MVAAPSSPSTGLGVVGMAPLAEQPRTVEEVLSKARPDWTARERAAARAKLEHAQIHSVEELETSLDKLSKGYINVRFQNLGFKCFSEKTLEALQRTLGGELPQCPAPPQAERCKAKPSPSASAPEVVPVVAQHRNVRIEGEMLVSESTSIGWGVVIFGASVDFVLSVQFTADPGPLKEPWWHYVIFGLVPCGVEARTLAATDQPWDWGVWVAPHTSPLEVWNWRKTPHDPIRVSDIPTALLAGQELQLRRDRGGAYYIVAEGAQPVPLPAMALSGNQGFLQPCVLLGRNTKVKVTLLLGRSAQPDKAQTIQANSGSKELAQEDAHTSPSDGVDRQVSAVAAEEADEVEGPAAGTLKEEPDAEKQHIHDRHDERDAEKEAVEDVKSEATEATPRTLGATSESCDSDESPASGSLSPAKSTASVDNLNPREQRLEDVRLALASRRSRGAPAVGDLVSFFEAKRKDL
uniref:Uncharacterized protein n=1 Tax=Pyrodinium bahamense TaxID=73915 RepID=A0A7S0FDD9_9DINO|mmetsp:Transcript_2262/g.6449  ORF Transcript_2262/g.6449 Transcript_2262/m.6449 type:complete len:465 (+) Transcript_2262:35-1429(+)